MEDPVFFFILWFHIETAWDHNSHHDPNVPFFGKFSGFTRFFGIKPSQDDLFFNLNAYYILLAKSRIFERSRRYCDKLYSIIIREHHD